MKVVVVAGARPNFMKIAPLMRAFDRQNRERCWGEETIESLLVHTGQHYDVKMSEIFFRELGIPDPDINLEVGSGSHAEQTADIMKRFEQVCLEHLPDWVVIVGDVNSTLACSIVATKLHINVAHVEAGLRSGDRTMPEEINRLVTDAIADLLLPPSEDGCENLRDEGIPEAKIKLVGNIMIDSLVTNLSRSKGEYLRTSLNLTPKNFSYVTLHRPSNVDTKTTLKPIIQGIASLAEKMPVVFPVHPRTRKMLDMFEIDYRNIDNLKCIDPIGYHDSLYLSKNSAVVITDSGGLQEETTYFQTPCLTLRPNTERPVTITVGSNKLTNCDKLSEDIKVVLDGPPFLGEKPPLWDGKTAERVTKELLNF